MAILTILASVMTPNILNQLRSARRDAEDRQLANIGKGIEWYLKQDKAFSANLAVLSLDYMPVSSGQLTNNGCDAP